MAIPTGKTEAHWNYFLAIERDLEVLSRYVEFDERNFRCFSIEIARIVLAASAEVDVVCKLVCQANKSNSTAKDIKAFRKEIMSVVPDIPDFEVSVPRFGLTLYPWDEWRSKNSPFWWVAYNKVKHSRDSQYHEASLKNALNAVAGLFVVVLYLYEEKAQSGELLPTPELLRQGPEHQMGVTIPGDNPVYSLRAD